MNQDGYLNITVLQHLFLSNSLERNINFSLLEYANVVNLARYKDGDIYKMAERLLPQLQSLASPQPHMPVQRYHNECFVQWLDSKVAIKDGFSEWESRLESARFHVDRRGEHYILRLGDPGPREVRIELQRLVDCSSTIRPLGPTKD